MVPIQNRNRTVKLCAHIFKRQGFSQVEQISLGDTISAPCAGGWRLHSFEGARGLHLHHPSEDGACRVPHSLPLHGDGNSTAQQASSSSGQLDEIAASSPTGRYVANSVNTRWAEAVAPAN
jgi:hypothetical protein